MTTALDPDRAVLPEPPRLPDLTGRDAEVVDAWWRAAMYLTVAQIYLQENALLREPLLAAHIKPRLLGHWGTSPGLALVYAHASRLVRETGQRAVYLAGPGHGGPALVAASWLEGTWSETYPDLTRDAAGLRRLVRQFSTPGGIPSHVSVTTPGSIHEGGELGYVLLHAFGAVMDDPGLLAVAVVGDGEAETGPLEGSWKGISFLDPVRDGAVLPVLHLNGAKISGPTVLGRKDPAEVRALLSGHGYEVLEVEGSDLPGMHHRFAAALATAWQRIRDIQQAARTGEWDGTRPRWPMIVLRSPKGWTGPHEVDGVLVEGTFRSHQVPLSRVREDPAHLAMLERWLRSYRPEELFDAAGRPTTTLQDPVGDLRLSAAPAANGGATTRALALRDLRAYAVDVPAPGVVRQESTRRLGRMLRDVYVDNPTSFRLFCPDETTSNRLGDVLDVSDRAFAERVEPEDDHLAHAGRVMEVLSEHSCHGWLEGYTLTGRHGLFATYEAFAMVSASQTVQHMKWLEEAAALPWRAPVPSLNLLLTSTAWRNDHNGFSHQGPGLLQVVLTHRGSVTRIYLPPDANCLLAVAEHCLGSRSYVNLVVIDKQPQLQWLDLDAAAAHCAAGAGTWAWAGHDPGPEEPDVVLACAGDTPTLETVAAAQILRERLPRLRTRVVNVVDLMSLSPDHPHALAETHFRELFTDTVDVVFAFHGFPGAVHQLVHGRPAPGRFHVRGFIEQGTTTTPFDMTVLNRISRFHLVIEAIERARTTPPGAQAVVDWCHERLAEHHAYVREHFEDLPAIRDWSLEG
ncbi:Xylulose-5-phosphate phosphoketolase [Nocardioides aquaticus]|uniref:Xylulose-5-phosphate phosphoketolase n=1 Tax=Nocardioides aquaticus TaxID=160826 RepID=A0ABX8EHU8_9ACTN|nr:phosphoketolase family protein [Nocardioides aquaticus]QVT79834.1 Xylulose-5-phosphate phosphoketolase [Nocardioides aquaticus]